MSTSFPPPYQPPRRPNALVTLLKAFAIGVGIFVCIGLLAGLMAQHELSGQQVLVVVVVVSWVSLITFVIRAVVNGRRRAAARQQQQLQYQQWLASLAYAEQQARERAAYDAEYARHAAYH